ncbi:D-alanyl-D-alanine carboxypeptidase, partial [Listeria monocytogenes]|nr:D-alanyl-D-alanine carboxypeptidase [Listeria monocytogenes]
MKNIIKKTGIVIMAASLAVSGFLVSPKAAQAAEAPNVNANAAIAIEESTG